MKIEINRVLGFEFYQSYLHVLEKYHLEIKKEMIKDNVIYRYYIYVNTIHDLFDIIKELKESLIINEDGTITIYDDYIE